jgi:hypothetical protein
LTLAITFDITVLAVASLSGGFVLRDLVSVCISLVCLYLVELCAVISDGCIADNEELTCELCF